MAYHIIATSQTDPGMIRERNEDAKLVHTATINDDDLALLVVADGMGGYRAGDRASALAIQTMLTELEPLFGPSGSHPTIKLKQATDSERSTVVLPETAESEHYGNFLTRAVQRANEMIVAYGREHRDARGLGSTVTAVLIARGRAYFANVGDSRTYLIRDGNIRAITRDHSLVARLVEDGQIEPDEIYTHPKRNLIYRSLGTAHESIEVDLFEEDLQPNDVLLLCSDGLWEKVRNHELLATVLQFEDLDEVGKQLIQIANKNGGEDNITIVLARCLKREPGDVGSVQGENAGTTAAPTTENTLTDSPTVPIDRLIDRDTSDTVEK